MSRVKGHRVKRRLKGGLYKNLWGKNVLKLRGSLPILEGSLGLYIYLP
jgi:hypothetical protein